MKRHTLLFILLSFLLVTGCKKDDVATNQVNASAEFKRANPGFAENEMVMYWNDKISTVLSAPMNQPTRARLFAIMHIAMHDALNNIKPKYQTYALHNHRDKLASPGAAVASAGYWVIKGMNRQGSFPVDDWYTQSMASITDGPEKDKGITLGRLAAEAIVADRANDGFSQVVGASINPPNGTTPGAYRQTNLNDLRFIPTWGTLVRPCVVSSNSAFRAPGPHFLNSPEYAADYNEVKLKGARVNSNRTDAEQTIARFWSENRPSIIWNNFTRAVIAGKKLDAWRTARLLAVLHTAMGDGINTIMESKYHFYSWRPETAINLGETDGNDQTAPVPGWVPNLIEAPSTNPMAQFVSPPVPEYPSGFSMYGGVAEKVLQWFFNTDQVSVSLSSSTLPGTVLQYHSISRAAHDNTIGKIHAGWYFRKGAEDGHQVGWNIADYVINHHFAENED
jgi:hypothetical protein